MDSYKIRPTNTDAPSDDERPPPQIQDKLWMLGVVALVFGLAVLANRRRE